LERLDSGSSKMLVTEVVLTVTVSKIVLRAFFTFKVGVSAEQLNDKEG
jgi:hypothetical protein